jgi:hypothetical protein
MKYPLSLLFCHPISTKFFLVKAFLLFSEQKFSMFLFYPTNSKNLLRSQRREKQFFHLGVTVRHCALIVIGLIITLAATCFDTYVPSSGSVLYPCELVKVRNCYSFIYYLVSYTFRHLCAIFRERPLSLWVTESPKLLCHQDVPLYCKCWCAPCVTVSSWADMRSAVVAVPHH